MSNEMSNENEDIRMNTENEEEIADEEKAQVVYPPKETVYVSNLNERVKINVLTRELQKLFSQFGTITNIFAKKTYRLRGQAWIVFAETDSAAKAVEKLQNFPFYDKPLKVTFAKEKSDIVSEKQGISIDKEKRAEEKKRKRERDEQERAKKPKISRPAKSFGNKNEAPNKILFVENLPINLDPKMSYEMLTTLFGQYEGFVDVRLVAGKGVAFVDYIVEFQATNALEGLQNFKVTPENPLVISYAKKA